MIHTILYAGMGASIAVLIVRCIRLSKENERISFKLRRAEENADHFSRQLIEKQAIEDQIKGNRSPCSLCEGCVHSIKFTPNENPLSNFRPIPIYNCRKNIRCKEYEEAKPC